MTTLRLGLLSTARINDEILGAAKETDRVEIAAVGSRETATAEAYAAEHDIARAHGSYEALLADAEVDAVYIPLPNALHHEWTMKALAAGKHVLCEKPYSRHPEEVEAAFAAAETAGLVLMEAFMYRHHPQTRHVEQLVREGTLGRLLSIRGCFTFPLTDLTNVRASTELDGGALMDVGCYCVSGARLLAGAGSCSRSLARTRCSPCSHRGGSTGLATFSSPATGRPSGSRWRLRTRTRSSSRTSQTRLPVQLRRSSDASTRSDRPVRSTHSWRSQLPLDVRFWDSPNCGLFANDLTGR